MGAVRKIRQLGQGMTEYIIIVALIAIAAITVYNLFGDTVRGQVGNMAAELGGSDSDTSTAKAKGDAAKAEVSTDYGLDDYTQGDN